MSNEHKNINNRDIYYYIMKVKGLSKTPEALPSYFLLRSEWHASFFTTSSQGVSPSASRLHSLPLSIVISYISYLIHYRVQIWLAFKRHWNLAIINWQNVIPSAVVAQSADTKGANMGFCWCTFSSFPNFW